MTISGTFERIPGAVTTQNSENAQIHSVYKLIKKGLWLPWKAEYLSLITLVITGPVTECAFARWHIVLPSCLDSVMS